ncbi:MAG: hypothetical protein H0U52_11380 [Chloroflexi bacterium]|nr:hypothetical protein [Chloroflexota bacterium]
MTEIVREACEVCAALSLDATAPTSYPAPVAADEWDRDDRIRGAMIGMAVGDAIGDLSHRDEVIPTDPLPAYGS